jgi:septal ring factor EnvC (AmiA/AmiB activator)
MSRQTVSIEVNKVEFVKNIAKVEKFIKNLTNEFSAVENEIYAPMKKLTTMAARKEAPRQGGPKVSSDEDEENLATINDLQEEVRNLKRKMEEDRIESHKKQKLMENAVSIAIRQAIKALIE